jgi:hypothetical protein
MRQRERDDNGEEGLDDGPARSPEARCGYCDSSSWDLGGPYKIFEDGIWDFVPRCLCYECRRILKGRYRRMKDEDWKALKNGSYEKGHSQKSEGS